MDIQDIEQKLWQAADKLRNNMDAAEYKHVVLGLIFLKYISDAFEEKHKKLSEDKLSDPEDKDEYLAENIFWVPKEARWSFLRDNAKQPNIGVLIDDAMDAIERDNPTLKGVLPKNYAREGLDKRRLGELIDVFSSVTMNGDGHKSKDMLGRIYEYFIGMFADAEGKRGGQFYTPRSIVRLLVEMLQPYKGRVYDPCCGSGGMFVQSEEFITEHEGRLGDISVYGQESNQTTWRLAKMNLAIRGIDADIKYGDTFHNDQLKDLKADFVLANPPFNDSDWGGELLRNDARWKYGVPPAGNSNFAWIQHIIYHLSPSGVAGIVMHGGAATNRGIEQEIRKSIVEASLLDCVVSIPSQMFFNVSLPAHLWILSREKINRQNDTAHKVLMIDAANYGFMETSTHRALKEDEVKEIADIYHEWRGGTLSDKGKKVAAEVDINQLVSGACILAPNRYVNSHSGNETNVGTNTIDTLEEIDKELQRIMQKLKVGRGALPPSNLDITGWDKSVVRDVVSEVVGGEWGLAEPKDGYILARVVRGTDLPNLPYFRVEKVPKRYIKESKIADKQLRPGDLVVEMSGGSKDQPTGRCALITESLLESLGEPVFCSNFSKIIRVKHELISPSWFYLYWSKSYAEGRTKQYENQPSGIRNFQLDEYLDTEDIIYPSLNKSAPLLDLINNSRLASDVSSLLSFQADAFNKSLFQTIYKEVDKNE